MHLDLAAVGHRDFGGAGDIAAVAHDLRDAAIDALRRRLAPADLLGDGIEHGKVLWMLRHQLAPELHGVLPDRMRQLIHEAFHVDRVRIDVDAAPEARRDVRIAHGMLDQQVRHGVADRKIPAGIEALERGGILAVLQRRRPDRVQDGLARQAEMQRRQIVVGIERAGQFALGDRMIGAVLHVVFARPQQFDRRARHLLGDRHRLPDIVGHAAPAEAAAEHVSCAPRISPRAGRRLPAPRRTRLRRSAFRVQTSHLSGV